MSEVPQGCAGNTALRLGWEEARGALAEGLDGRRSLAPQQPWLLFAASSSGDAAGEAAPGCSTGTEHGRPEHGWALGWKLRPDSVMRLGQGQSGGKRVQSPGDRG